MTQNKNIWAKKILQAHIKINVLFGSEFNGIDYPLSSPHPDSRVLVFFMQMFVIYLVSPALRFLHLEASSIYHTEFAHQISQDLKIKTKRTENYLLFLPVVFQETVLTFIFYYKSTKPSKPFDTLK